jgi:ankyrin repeat protein
MMFTNSPERLRNAITDGDLAAVQSLIQADRSLLHAIVVPGGPNRNYRPVTHAAVEGQLAILGYLIDEGCDVREDHNYPMFRAALYDDCVPALAMLAARGAAVNGVWADYGPPLIATCENAALGCMRWLLDNGAAIAGRAQGVSKMVEWDAVVHAAQCHKEHPDLLRLLLDRGGDVNGREGGDSALHVVARRGDIAGVKLLLERGADPAGRDSRGRTAVEVTRNRQVRELITV